MKFWHFVVQYACDPKQCPICNFGVVTLVLCQSESSNLIQTHLMPQTRDLRFNSETVDLGAYVRLFASNPI